MKSSFASEKSGNIEKPNRENENRKRERPTLKPPPTIPFRQTKKEKFVSDYEIRTSQIQRIFPKDKVTTLMVPSHHSSSACRSTEECFRESLKGIKRQTLSLVDVETSEPKREKYTTNVRRVLTPKTVGNSSDQDHDIRRSTHRKARLDKTASLKHSTSSKGNKIFVSKNPSTECSKAIGVEPKRRVNSRRPSTSDFSSLFATSEKMIRIISSLNHNDGCSVSTVTRSSSICSTESIMSEMALAHNTGSKKCATSQPINNEDDTSIADSSLSCYIGSDADDFGSIAHSLPSCGQAELMEYLEEIL